jgi:hypothetical protein
MTEYAMALKNGKDIIHKSNQQTLEEAKKYFAGVKQMPIEEFNKLFIVIKIEK